MPRPRKDGAPARAPRKRNLTELFVRRARPVRAAIEKIAAPVLANQVLAAASAIFSWAIKMEVLAVNPCKLVERNETRSRERVLSDGEVPRFWATFDSAGLIRGAALKMILLT